jgi:hypothetical protein
MPRNAAAVAGVAVGAPRVGGSRGQGRVMLLRPPRSRWIDPTVRNVLLTISAALVGTAVGGVGVLSVVTAMIQPLNPDLRASNAGVTVAAPPLVVIASMHETEGSGRAPTDRTAPMSPGPAYSAAQGAKAQNASPVALLGSAEAGSRAGDQSPAAQPGSGNDEVGASGSDKRQGARHTSASRSRRLAVTGGGSTRDGATGQSASNNAAANFAAAQRRGLPARPLYDYSGGWSFRDDRYPEPPRPPRRVIMQRGGGERFGGWGGSFGGNGWGDYRY